MRKHLVSPTLLFTALTVLTVLTVFALGATSAAAHVQIEPVEPQTLAEPVDPVPVDPEPIAPLPWASVHLVGDTWANGSFIGAIDFGLIWNVDDPSEAQLWALLHDVPTQICVGRIFETPQGEPIFFGDAPFMPSPATCYMSRLPNHEAIALHVASDDGQWVTSLMRNPSRVGPVDVFGN